MFTKNHYLLTQEVCRRALAVFNMPQLHFLPMRKQADQINTKRGYVIGRTNLKTGLITIDIFTPKFRKPKAIASILRTLAHEVAHHQKPPYRSRFRGHILLCQKTLAVFRHLSLARKPHPKGLGNKLRYLKDILNKKIIRLAGYRD
ncbi:MAG: hypothetical protein UW34_C0002G0046 [Parcubacteria group bacterium GW2011_GWA2_44_15]|nr:MAG: hypothetical protein UW34_C0002G0046 [Parcubacteria group bacterium GW2011_GWA2_44_15]